MEEDGREAAASALKALATEKTEAEFYLNGCRQQEPIRIYSRETYGFFGELRGYLIV